MDERIAMYDNPDNKNNRLEYIRIRLYLMASRQDFEEMVKMKVHLYMEHVFKKELAVRMGISKKSSNIGILFKIARAKLRALENENDTLLYEMIANDYTLNTEMDVVVLPENWEHLKELLKEYT